jgi:O-succinylbenzoate synthase
VRIRTVELIRLELRLVAPLVTSQGTHHDRPILLVRITTDDAVGTGECSALAEPTYTAEYADEAERMLETVLIPRLLARGPEAEDAASFFERLEVIPGNPMAKAAIELALLDAQLRADGRSIADFIGAARDSIEAGATIGIATPSDSARAAQALVEAGFGRIKIKIAPGADSEVVVAVRKAIGISPRISVDANGAYCADDGEDLQRLRALDALGLTAIEQPFPADDLTAHVMLRRMIRTPIILDESIVSSDDLERAMSFGAADAVSIKPARLGGVAASMEICRLARTGGLELVVGGMLESGIGRAVAICFAASDGFTMPGDLGPSGRYFARDLTEPHRMTDGMLAVPRGPGIGVAIDEDAIGSATSRSVLVTAS